MENQPPVEKKSNNKVIIILGVVLLVCVCIVVIVIAALAVVGPAVQKTNEQIQQQLQTVETVQPGQQESGYSGIADPQLRGDVLKSIADYESTQNNCSDVSLVSGQVLDLAPNRTIADPWVETWQINACGTSHLYSVSFTPSPQGGTDYSVKKLDQ